MLRFSNELVLGNCQLVLDTVLAAIDGRLAPSPGSLRSPPSPAEGEGFTRRLFEDRVTALLLANARLVDPAASREGAALCSCATASSPMSPGRRRRRRPKARRSSTAAARCSRRASSTCAPSSGEPGAEHRETLETASEAAAAGGVTTIVCMPDTNPVIDDPAIVDFVLRRARDTAIVNILPRRRSPRASQGREMTEIGLLERGRRGRLHGRRALVSRTRR